MIITGKQLSVIGLMGDSTGFGGDGTNAYDNSLKTFNYNLAYNQTWVWAKDNTQTNNGTMQKLVIGTNSGYGTQSQNITPLASMMHRLALDKDAQNYMMVNYGVSGSTMTDIGGANAYGTWDTNPPVLGGGNSYLCYPHYINYRLLPALLAAKNGGFDPVVREIYIFLGTNDAQNATKSASYSTKATELMNRVISDLQANGWITKYIKFCFIKPNANLNIGSFVSRDVVRTAIDNLSGVEVFDYSDLGLYPLLPDGVHWTNNAGRDIGYDLHANKVI